jgi:hypothetical protein
VDKTQGRHPHEARTMKTENKDPEGAGGQASGHEIPLSDWRRTVRRDFADIRDFYLDEEQKARLEKMGRFSRWLYLAGWLLKSLFLKLTPLRRVLIVIALYCLLLFDLHFTLVGIEVNLRLVQLSGLILVFILMLEL